MSEQPAPAPQPPLLRVVRGEPSAEELVALIAVVAAGSAAEIAAAPTLAGWAARDAVLRRPLVVGRSGWQLAGRTPGARTRADW